MPTRALDRSRCVASDYSIWMISSTNFSVSKRYFACHYFFVWLPSFSSVSVCKLCCWLLFCRLFFFSLPLYSVNLSFLSSRCKLQEHFCARHIGFCGESAALELKFEHVTLLFSSLTMWNCIGSILHYSLRNKSSLMKLVFWPLQRYLSARRGENGAIINTKIYGSESINFEIYNFGSLLMILQEYFKYNFKKTRTGWRNNCSLKHISLKNRRLISGSRLN